jgi:iron complex transport system permease protein
MPIAILCVAALASIAVSCLAGSVGLNLAELLAVVGGTTDEAGSVTSELLQLRMNRTLCAFSVGAMLALSGVLMQAMLRNPLADPYVLGVSGGAAVGALAAMLLAGLGWATDLAALGGALAVALLLLTLAYRDVRGAGGEASSVNLLLTGVVIASGCGALITLMLSIAPDERLRGMVFWLVGDLAGAEARVLPWLLLAAVLVLSMRSARAINLLAMHAEGAAVLGVAVGRIRLMLFLFSALLTAAAVATAGSIGFVGLIVPHACRFLFGPDHRLLIPVAALAGGTFLVLADTASRIVLAPHQLPVGAVTALIGVPVFLFQLHRERRR